MSSSACICEASGCCVVRRRLADEETSKAESTGSEGEAKKAGTEGEAKKAESEVTVTTTAGPVVTLPWAAPEVLRREAHSNAEWGGINFGVFV